MEKWGHYVGLNFFYWKSLQLQLCRLVRMLMRRRAVPAMADPDVEEHNKTCCVDTAGHQQESVLTGGGRPVLSSFAQSPVYKRFSRIFLTLSACSSFSHYFDMIIYHRIKICWFFFLNQNTSICFINRISAGAPVVFSMETVMKWDDWQVNDVELERSLCSPGLMPKWEF